MQRRLSIKNNHITILHMSFHYITILQILFSILSYIAEILSYTICTDNVLGTCFTGRWVRTILYQLFQPALFFICVFFVNK